MQFHKHFNNKIIGIAGTWDPPLPRHLDLFKQFTRYSKKNGLNPYVLIFYPNPVNYLRENKHKDYFDLDARIELCRQHGLPNVIAVNLTREDLETDVGDFFDQLAQHTGVVFTELWMGENQSLGGGPQGFGTSRKECLARNIKLRVLKNSFLLNLDKEAIYRDINAGNFQAVAAIIGHYPAYKVREDGLVNMHDGMYDGVLRIEPFSGVDEQAVRVKIVEGRVEGLVAQGGFEWLVLVGRVGEGVE